MVEVMNSIVNFFKNAGSYVGVDLLSLIAFGLLVLVIFISIIVSSFSVEVRTNRKVKQINSYLQNNPFITDENIVEFNRIMKNKIPRAMRYQWQRYMVNRNERPSHYLSEDNCMTKPFRTSAFVQCVKFVKYCVAIIAMAAFIFILGAIYDKTDNLPSTLLRCGAIPVIILVVGVLFLMLLNARRSAVLSDLYFNFDGMQHLLDRAVATFPAFVDYEILFTRKEISAGIPALQEYLQQRAQYEQEELERARLSQVEHEKYDFSKLGIKGTMIMERAMKECEFYLGNRRILLADIDSLQTQKDLITKNFDEKNRANQRKLRDIKETIDRLREKLNTTTNKIVGNDIIKQQADEVKKQQIVEKEIEDDSNHYAQDLQKLDAQIDKKKQEIDNNRKEVERVLVSDFKDYSDKIYDELKNIADTQVTDELNQLKEDKTSLQRELEEREQYIAERNTVIGNNSVDDLLKQLHDKENDIEIKNQEIIGINKDVESRNAEINKLTEELENVKRDKYHEVYRYFDSTGKEFFYDENKNPYYYDNDGKKVYYDKLGTELVETKPEEVNIVEEVKPVIEQEKVVEPVIEEKVEEIQPKVEDTPLDENELASLESVEETEIDKQIEEQTKVLEENHKDLQKHIDEAEKVIDEQKVEEPKEEPKVVEPVKEVKEEPKKEETKTEDVVTDFGDFFKGLEEAPDKKEEPKKEPTKKVEEKPKKVEPKKTVTAKPKQKKELKKTVKPLTKITDLEKKEPSDRPMKKRPAKKGPAFVVKKAPKASSGNGKGFDLSAFDSLAGTNKKGKK